MVTFARFMKIERLVSLIVVSIFSAIVIAVNAAYINTTLNTTLYVDYAKIWPQTTVDTFAAFNLVVAGLTSISLLVMRVVDRLRRGAFTSMIVFELSWLGLLDILWIAAGAYTTDKFNPVKDFCNMEQSNPAVPNLHLACSTIQASMAFSYLNFVVLLVHLALLLILALMYNKNGVSVWTRTVRDIVEMPSAAPSSGSSVAYAQQEQVAMKVPLAASYDAPVNNAPSVPYQPTTYQPTSYQPTTYTPTTMQNAPQTTQGLGSNNVIQV